MLEDNWLATKIQASFRGRAEMKMTGSVLKMAAAGSRRRLFVCALLGFIPVATNLAADGQGTIQFTKRFGGESVVVEVDWFYDRSVPSLTFDNRRVIWTGDPVPDGGDGSDGLFHIPSGDLIVANWQSSNFVKLEPGGTDMVLDGPVAGPFAFHTLLHPNLDDFLAAPAFGEYGCTSDESPIPCFGVNAHTPLTVQTICRAPAESESGDELQPHTFIADGDLNVFVLYSNGEINIQFGGAGFASFDLADTASDFCSPDMVLTRLIPQEIPSAHSISWSPFLSDTFGQAAAASAEAATEDGDGPHSDFITFANHRIGHIRVMNPGTEGATAEVVSEVDMTTEAACAMLLPEGEHEFDQGAVTGSGIALVADEHTPYVALIDYSQNQNGTIRDPDNMVCLVAHLEDGIDDIAPLTGLGALNFYGPGNTGGTDINAGHSGAYFEERTAGQGLLAEFVPNPSTSPATEKSRITTEQSRGFAFASWFTYTPDDSDHPFEQQWYTMQGNYSGDRAFLDIFETLGGAFDDNDPVDTNKVGTANWVMHNCRDGELVYNFDDGRRGAIPFTRVIPGSEGGCQSLAAAATQTVDINAGMDGAWFEPATSGQGFFLDVQSSIAPAGGPGVEASTGFAFAAWYTYGAKTASGQQWYTAQGSFTDSMAAIDIFETTGGSFDDPRTPATVKVGTMSLDFDDCENVDIAYAFDGGPSGDIDATRVVPNAAALCDQLASPN
jgi:hypothetical protein